MAWQAVKVPVQLIKYVVGDVPWQQFFGLRDFMVED
jgi:hypothetical protein